MQTCASQRTAVLESFNCIITYSTKILQNYIMYDRSYHSLLYKYKNMTLILLTSSLEWYTKSSITLTVCSTGPFSYLWLRGGWGPANYSAARSSNFQPPAGWYSIQGADKTPCSQCCLWSLKTELKMSFPDFTQMWRRYPSPYTSSPCLRPLQPFSPSPSLP